MSCPSLTPLQAYAIALRDLVLDARRELDATAYTWFVAVATEVLGLESSRLILGEVRLGRRDSEEAA